MKWLKEWGLRRWLKHKTYWAIIHAVRRKCILDWQHACIVCRKVAPGFHVHRDTLREWNPAPYANYRWPFYKVLWRICRPLAYKMHGLSCPRWCGGHNRGKL